VDRNPYAPPQAAVADRIPPTETGLKKRRVLVMIVLMFVTLGLYYPIWFFRRRNGLNRLHSPRKLQLWPLLAFAVVYGVAFAVDFVSAESTPAQTIGPAAAGVLVLARLAIGILMVVQCFTIKDMLEDHAAGPDNVVSRSMFVEPPRFSGLMTFFFQIFYLQYLINRHVVGSQQSAV
jgi:hypothetical protein